MPITCAELGSPHVQPFRGGRGRYKHVVIYATWALLHFIERENLNVLMLCSHGKSGLVPLDVCPSVDHTVTHFSDELVKNGLCRVVELQSRSQVGDDYQ